jgi:hypothetical protein
MSKKQKQMERVENTAAELMYVAEQWTLTGATMWDLKTRRARLLNAARDYGRAMDALGRTRS